MHALRRRGQRGTSLIEAMIAIAVLLLGMAGFASLQTIVVRGNHFARRIAAASTLATDFTENVKRWPYTDSRLNPATPVLITGCTTVTLNLCTAAVPTASWDLGRLLIPTYAPQFDDSVLGASWQGISADVDPTVMTGTDPNEFFRYWNVYDIDPGGTGVPLGKLVQVIIRWKEPVFGYRQITSTTFKLNLAALAL